MTGMDSINNKEAVLAAVVGAIFFIYFLGQSIFAAIVMAVLGPVVVFAIIAVLEVAIGWLRK